MSIPIPILASSTPQPMTWKEEWTSRIVNVIQNHFSLKHKDQAYMYWHPYPEAFYRVPLPDRYRMLDFSKFSIEHISRFLA
jgi:hypothetical protein